VQIYKHSEKPKETFYFGQVSERNKSVISQFFVSEYWKKISKSCECFDFASIWTFQVLDPKN
jgi:hypothetical protein